jgi:hypothetical protein
MARSKPRDIYRPPVAEASTCSSSPRRRAPLISAASRRRGASVAIPYAPGYSCRHRACHNVAAAAAAEHGAGVAPLAGVAGVARAPREPRFASYQKGRQHFSCSKEPQTSRPRKKNIQYFQVFFSILNMSSTNTTVLKPLAPKVNNQNRTNSSKESLAQNSENVTSTTHGPIRGGTKRKAFHPTLGYAIPPPVPAKVMRRNARERNRVKQVCTFINS